MISPSSDSSPSPARKHRQPRPDAKLLNLPEERQAQIWEWCKKPMDRDADGQPIPGSGGQTNARAQLLADGFSVSLAALSSACSFWAMQADFAAANNKTEDWERMLREDFPHLTTERIAAMGQAHYTMQAVSAGDAEKFREMEYLRLAKETGAKNAALADAKLAQKEKQLAQKDKEIALAIEKFQWDGAKEALAKLKELKSIAADRSLNDDQKIEQVRLRLWGAVPKEMEGKA